MTEIENTPEVDRKEKVYREASELYSRNPDWVTFFREIIGLNGLIRRSYPTPDSLAEFERTQTYAEILQLVTSLRRRKMGELEPQEPTRVITVRLPKSLHEALRVEAHEYRTSMNKLCISKLLQFIETELVPSE